MPDEPSTEPDVTPTEVHIAARDVTELSSTPVDTGYTTGGVPTFESVREKIETRYASSVGSVELAAETPEGRSAEEQYDARQKAAAERLAEIRRSMHTDQDNVQ